MKYVNTYVINHHKSTNINDILSTSMKPNNEGHNLDVLPLQYNTEHTSYQL